MRKLDLGAIGDAAISQPTPFGTAVEHNFRSSVFSSLRGAPAVRPFGTVACYRQLTPRFLSPLATASAFHTRYTPIGWGHELDMQLTSWRNGMFGRLKAVIKRIRQLNAATERPKYIGHKANRIYHRHDCKYGMKMRRGRRFLYSQSQARAEDFRPCNFCQPHRHPYKPGEKPPSFWDSLRSS